ncbi:hypothetical protein LR48_Vigan2301s000100 [Vigna angularis]|nr:hypothetical protein LR48_Vigan2301s000100 [Vigna angularis]
METQNSTIGKKGALNCQKRVATFVTFVFHCFGDMRMRFQRGRGREFEGEAVRVQLIQHLHDP